MAKKPVTIRRLLMTYFCIRTLIPALLFVLISWLVENKIIDPNTSRTASSLVGPLLIFLGALSVINFLLFLVMLLGRILFPSFFRREPGDSDTEKGL